MLWLCVLLFGTLVTCERVRYDGYIVVRVTPNTQQELDYTRAIYQQYGDEVDLWKEPSILGRPVDIQLSPAVKSLVLNDIKDMQHYVMIPDLQAANDATYPDPSQPKETRDFSAYKTLDEINSYISRQLSVCSGVGLTCAMYSIGKSFENRDINVFRIGADPSSSSKRAVYIDAGIHAREWIAPATSLYILERLLNNYTSDATVQRLVDTYDWYFQPNVNPDGYVFSWTNDRMWRKTRATFPGETCRGTDANRNFGFRWGLSGSSTDPCSSTFHGPWAFSENETVIERDYVMSLDANTDPARHSRIFMHLSLHSYSQLWLGPWGWTDVAVPDHNALMAVASVGVQAIEGVHGEIYHDQPSWQLYITSGTTADWAYGPKNDGIDVGGGIKYSYTLELRDDGVFGFDLPATFIIPTGEEVYAGVIASIAEAERQEGGTP